jgi:hypothetical protein
MAEEAIHKKNLATLPTFYGNKEQDSIKAEDLIRRIETNMKATTLNWSDEMAFLYFEMALKGNANEWLFSQKQYTANVFTAFRNVFLKKYGDRLDHTRIYDGYHKMKYRAEQPVERYIYAHTHHHRAISDLGEQAKYKDSIKKATCKAAFDLADENLVDTFEAGRSYESELLLVSALVSKLPEEIRHKFDDLPLSDLTVPKIADRIELFRNRHLKAKAKAAIAAAREKSSLPPTKTPNRPSKPWLPRKSGPTKRTASGSSTRTPPIRKVRDNPEAPERLPRSDPSASTARRMVTLRTPASLGNERAHPATARKVNPTIPRRRPMKSPRRSTQFPMSSQSSRVFPIECGSYPVPCSWRKHLFRHSQYLYRNQLLVQ